MASPEASPSRQSPWKGHAPGKGSAARSWGTRRWPISGCTSPWTRRPWTSAPPPMPVPTVTYTKGSDPRPAPHACSASAAPFTSVSNRTGTWRARANGPARSTCDQPGFGVLVTCPHVGEAGSRSTGPNDAMPSAATGPCCAKNATAAAMVSAGAPVGTRVSARMSSGPVPTAQTSFVPPASTPPSAVLLNRPARPGSRARSALAVDASRPPVLALVRGHVVAAREQRDEHDAGHEPADVGPEGHPAPLAAAAGHHAQELERHPVQQHRPRGERDRGDEEPDRYQRVHANPRVQDQIRAHDAADRARGADHRDTRRGVQCHLGQRRRRAAQQVEDGKAAGPHGDLDVVAEDPDGPQVAEQVPP